MNLFKKKKIKNEIDNNEVLTMLENYAFQLLFEGKDYQNINSLKSSFGYCIYGVNDELEALYKVTTDLSVAYFQAIHGKVLRLNLDEEKYNWAVQVFYNNNPTLKP